MANGNVEAFGCNLRQVNHVPAEAPPWLRPKFGTHLPPSPGVPARNEGMSDLMQDGVFDLGEIIQLRQRPGQRDQLPRRPATAKPALGVVKPELPVRQAMFIDEPPCQGSGFVDIHGSGF